MDGVDLYWLPLGAGRFAVRCGGWLYEAVTAAREARPRRRIYHAALVATFGDEPYVVEMAPVWQDHDEDRGVVGEGPVASRLLGRSRWFRYEVRCWRHGRIPDLEYAVGGAVRAVEGHDATGRVLAAVRRAPLLTWGTDESGLGEMWNSNSLIAWVLEAAGIDASLLRPPEEGIAPGWSAGLAGVSRTCP